MIMVMLKFDSRATVCGDRKVSSTASASLLYPPLIRRQSNALIGRNSYSLRSNCICRLGILNPIKKVSQSGNAIQSQWKIMDIGLKETVI